MRLWSLMTKYSEKFISQYKMGTLVEYHGYDKQNEKAELYYKGRVLRVISIDGPCLKAEPVEECYIDGQKFYWVSAHCSGFRKVGEGDEITKDCK